MNEAYITDTQYAWNEIRQKEKCNKKTSRFRKCTQVKNIKLDMYILYKNRKKHL